MTIVSSQLYDMKSNDVSFVADIYKYQMMWLTQMLGASKYSRCAMKI